MTYPQWQRQQALRDARRDSRSDRLDRRIPVLDGDFDNISIWS